ncbi:uncharacterized protein LOC118805145 isoform X2 [Colossoma macropomum]|uniref:uncharacterized protein LOC118805145 isoform X2 n=1 Tax=Colossoma macropomum TaxID=42526 RepID=UPI001863A56D|nr:uncharacterized protein LOC118805145 isoform X2 [Colossoma macropomum]
MTAREMDLLLFFVLLLAAGLQGLHVEGPSGPLVVPLGGAVLLPCSAQDPLPLEGLRVEWSRTDSESVVNVFQQKEIRAELQSQSFRGRADFFPEEISRGNFSILLSDVTPEDAGVYRCGVSSSQDYRETTVEIKLSERLVVRGALHPIFTSVGEEVILSCSVDSQIPVHQLEEVTWKKYPDIPVLLFQENQTFSEFSHESYRERAEFFTTEIPRGNFSLRLKDVRMEDKGQFICEVHTADLSGQTTVIIQQIGFSSVQICILLLCFTSLTLAVGLGAPVFIFLHKRETDRRAMIMYIFLAFSPNICMFIAFGLWSTEGFLSEVIICSAVSLARCLMLMKTAPYLNTLPERWVREVKTLSAPLYYTIIATVVFSVEFANRTGIQYYFYNRDLRLAERSILVMAAAVYGIGSIISARFSLRICSFLCLEVYNCALLIVFIHDESDTPDIYNMISGVFMVMLLLLSLQRHCFQQKPFKCLHIGVSFFPVAAACLLHASVFACFGIRMKNFAHVWTLPFTAVMYVTVWIAVVFVMRRQHENKKPRCSKWRGTGYVCCAVGVSITVTINGIIYLHFLRKHMTAKDYSGYSALMVLLHVLPPAVLFDHPRNIPKLPHIILHLFGSSGLSVVTSLTLALELILKSGTGEPRTLPEMHIIILPFESLFISGWIALQIYDTWMRMRRRIKSNFEAGGEADLQVGEDGEEMEVLSSLSKSPEC